ncbi:hypothetical protein SAMN02745148_02714 [Modicisalibacter ilicicola DSM 19980]|uniref:Uncharacterized protein n=1 Tax=Modicisalibacter ilicicola DSM 19980 TaxID=1121942 RepID=A0A1M5BWP2_9GAMM|nr:hypothetical protein [Halomonas ilicicola]SHF46811.1 hypothetical protein SAMN02745148_02714 [Halomonas ilicicola DSM 19980]
MMKKLVCILLTGLALPAWAAEATLELPVDARIDVQVIDTVTLDGGATDRTDVLLRPVTHDQADGARLLPDYCLITANAQLDDQRVRLTTQSVTCIEAEDDSPEIYSGELSAAAFERDGGFGLDVCTNKQNGQCVKAVIEPAHHFQLSIGETTRLTAQANPSEELNRQRRQADDDGNANAAPAEGSEPGGDTR